MRIIISEMIKRDSVRQEDLANLIKRAKAETSDHKEQIDLVIRGIQAIIMETFNNDLSPYQAAVQLLQKIHTKLTPSDLLPYDNELACYWIFKEKTKFYELLKEDPKSLKIVDILSEIGLTYLEYLKDKQEVLDKTLEKIKGEISVREEPSKVSQEETYLTKIQLKPKLNKKLKQIIILMVVLCLFIILMLIFY